MSGEKKSRFKEAIIAAYEAIISVIIILIDYQ